MVLPGCSYYLPSNPAELIGALPEFGDGYPYYDQLPRELSTDSPRDGEPRGRRALSHGAAAMDGGPPAPSSGGPGRCRLACARPPAAVRSRTSVRWCRRAGRAGLVAWAGSRVGVRARNPRPGPRRSAGPATLGRASESRPGQRRSAAPANLGRASESICNRLRDTSGGASHRGWEELALAGEPSAVGWRLVVVKMESYRFAGD
jgi:hypothetical protein